MGFEALTLAMLVALPGETPEHADVIAAAIAEASGGNRLVAAEAIALGYFESGYMPRIQAGECRKLECDRGRARSWWQFQRTSWSRDAWESSLGLELEPVLTASQVAVRVLRAGNRVCHTVAGAMSFYAVGHCGWRGGERRAVLVSRLLAVRSGA